MTCLHEAMHKNQVQRPLLSLYGTCCVEQSPRRAPPYYGHWSIQMRLKTVPFSSTYYH